MVEDKICVVAVVRPRLVMFLSQNLGIFFKAGTNNKMYVLLPTICRRIS